MTQVATTPLLRTPYQRNGKIHDKTQIAQIAASIREFGFNVPVLMDGKHHIIAGHGRVMEAKELGMESVPVIEEDHLTDVQRRAFIIADNKLTKNSRWDTSILALKFKGLGKLDLSFYLEITGFSVNDIDLIIGKDTEEDKQENLEEIFQTSEGLPVGTKPGDIWQLGKYRLICGDSTQTETYKQLLGKKKATLINADPP